MPVQHISPTIEKQARSLAADNLRAEPEVKKIYWFPNDSEVRLIELIAHVPASADGEIHPFYFRAEPADDLPAPSAIVMIRPDEWGRLRLPPQWGEWSDAVEL